MAIKSARDSVCSDRSTRLDNTSKFSTMVRRLGIYARYTRYITDKYQLGLKDLCSEKIIDKDKKNKKKINIEIELN